MAGYWGRYLLDVYEPRSYLYPWNFCTLGYALRLDRAARREGLPRAWG
ncbi:MAG: hypothetical protein Ct9H300mP1_23130 [Planctomycetaceae bacterium]|nr:MAG: hypothetical protein Ct9H300mP1_23130 [Planctomycetaceae bacterium]